MNGKERLLAALDGKPLDRLPVTTHHILDYFSDTYMGGRHYLEFFKEMGMDPIFWVDDWKTAPESEDWRIERVELPDPRYFTERLYIHTPKKTLTMVLQSNQYTTWVSEKLLKDKNDLDVIAAYLPAPTANKALVEKAAAEHPDCLIRGTVACLSPLGQPGCWQELAMLYDIQDLIMETYEDPEWVEEGLQMIMEKKLKYVDSLQDVPYDILELGGGHASTTVISPKMFDEYVAPYDSKVIERARARGQRIVYHTCGGMMPILEKIAAMGPNAMETFTPVGMGGDTDLAEARRRLGDKVCMIGGFDQGHHFINCSEEETRANVRRCFQEAGAGGRFILSPSDHFFDADPKLIKACADEAIRCTY